MVIDSPKGNFRFLKGSGPYSSGAVAADGYEVVHVIFNPLPSLWKAFDLVEAHLKSLNRPLNALCGIFILASEELTHCLYQSDFGAKPCESLGHLTADGPGADDG